MVSSLVSYSMSHRTFARTCNAVCGLTLATGLLLVSAIGGADYVILKDGTVLQGRLFKEKANITDSLGKMMVQVDKANGLQGIDDGPKTIFFGSIGSQIGETGNDPAFRPEFKKYEKYIPASGTQPLPGSLQLKALDFDADWKTQFRIETGNGHWQIIKLHLTYLDPHTAFIVSSSHRWRLTYDTKEFGPVYARKLLVTHPELVEKDGKGVPAKRVAIAQFMKDAGWFDAARQELEKAKVDCPPPWPADVTERADRLRAAINRDAAHTIALETDKAVASGRYAAARKAMEQFKPEQADPKDVTRVATLKSQLDGITPRYEKIRTLLTPVVDRLGGLGFIRLQTALAGGLGAAVANRPAVPLDRQTLAEAGDAVLAELHPDSAGRLDLFLGLAEQSAIARANGNTPSQSDEQLIALAVTGWLKGKNGASADVPTALRCWHAREMMLNYQRLELANERAKLLANYTGTGSPIAFDELAQIISLLPPPQPVNPDAPGTPAAASVAGVFMRNTGPLDERAAGVDYALRLPPEYHPGRSYPLLIALGPALAPPAELVARLAPEADRHGYIVAAPNWAHKVDKNGLYDFSGEAHSVVTDTLRDLFRRVQVDPDRVMLFGLADGGSFALDMAASHPDLFAGVAPFGAFPRSDVFMYYWSNLQKVPVYAVSGELASEGNKLMYRIFQDMLKSGFPSLMTIYKGRAVEFYSAEIEPMFDWFDRRVRPPTSSVVKPLKGLNFSWVSMRKTDKRFYWVSLNEIAKTNTMERRGVYPAGINPDIRTGNQVYITTRGVRSFNVLFERDMIDWTKPLSIQVNGNVPPGYKPKILQPDLNVLLEEFLATGDRKRIILQRMTFGGY
jgi:dienelactone hydrolase